MGEYLTIQWNTILNINIDKVINMASTLYPLIHHHQVIEVHQWTEEAVIIQFLMWILDHPKCTCQNQRYLYQSTHKRDKIHQGVTH